jgi:hypothetical protein
VLHGSEERARREREHCKGLRSVRREVCVCGGGVQGTEERAQGGEGGAKE